MSDRDICQEVSRDCNNDARSLEREPFTGAVIGKRLGEIYAMVATLADVMARQTPEE